jgi:glycosyltransferase involved in cell wall biosynthesis
MILLYELSQTGLSHSPFTSSFAQSVAYALPGQEIVVYSRASHLAAAFADLDPGLARRFALKPIVPENFCAAAGPFAAIWRNLRVLHDTYATWRSQSPLVIFLTGEPQQIWAAKLMKRLAPDFRCHLVLHGDVNSVVARRSRNPVNRLTDYNGSIGLLNHPDIRFIALESHIKTNLAALFPSAAACIDVVHHPCTPLLTDLPANTAVDGPIRFALLGIAGRSKGLDLFARLAKEITTTLPGAADFRLIGKVQPGYQQLDLDAISGPRPFSETWLPVDVFETELSSLHYVVLPYRMDYYAFAASGVLLDALRWRKPIIALRTPAVDELVRRFGEIGHVVDSYDEMAAVARRAVTDFDAQRYMVQQRNLDAAYHSRLPQEIATEYAAIVESRWG